MMCQRVPDMGGGGTGCTQAGVQPSDASLATVARLHCTAEHGAPSMGCTRATMLVPIEQERLQRRALDEHVTAAHQPYTTVCPMCPQR